MAVTLDTFRQRHPWAAQIGDAELIQEISSRAQMPMQDVATAFGVQSGRDRGILRSGLSTGLNQLQSIGYSAVAGAADALGRERTQDWANRGAARNQAEAALSGRPELSRIQDLSWDNAPSFVAYQALVNAPTVAAMVGAQFVPGLGKAAAATGLTRLAAAAPTFVGGAGLRAGATEAVRQAAMNQGRALATATMVGTGMGFGSLY